MKKACREYQNGQIWGPIIKRWEFMTVWSFKRIRKFVWKMLLESKTLLSSSISKFSEISNCRINLLFHYRGLKLGHLGIFDALFPFLAFFKLKKSLVNIWARGPSCKRPIWEFKKWRQQRLRHRHKWMIWLPEWKKNQRQQQRHKSMIWLIEWRKIIVLQAQHAFWCNFWRSLPNDDVKFSFLRFCRQRELAAVNLSFFAFTWKPFVPSKRKCTPPILYNVMNME